MQNFICGNRDKLNWRMMIVYEDLVGLGQLIPGLFTAEMFDDAVATAKARLGEPPAGLPLTRQRPRSGFGRFATAELRSVCRVKGLRLESYHEGRSAQIMHVGPPSAEAPTIARLHMEFLPAHNLIPNGHHHEIYLTDPNRVAPEKLKTVLRQPVRSSG